MKTGCDREKVSWKLFESLLGALQVGRQITFFTVDLDYFPQNCPMLQAKGSYFVGGTVKTLKFAQRLFPGRSVLSYLSSKHLTSPISGLLKQCIQPKKRYSTVPPIREIWFPTASAHQARMTNFSRAGHRYHFRSVLSMLSQKLNTCQLWQKRKI